MRIVKGFILIVFVCVFIRMVIGEPCIVPTESMEPTLVSGDRLWINKLAYGGRLPRRWADIPLINAFTWIRVLREADEHIRWNYHRLPGYTHPKVNDVVVFNSPSDRNLLLVKRVSQVIEKGDTIEINKKTVDKYRSLIIRDGGDVAVYRNRIFINGRVDSVYVPWRTYYFMEGDNHSHSQDSRYFGYISEEAVVGKFDFVLFSLDPLKSFWESIRWDRILKRVN